MQRGQNEQEARTPEGGIAPSWQATLLRNAISRTGNDALIAGELAESSTLTQTLVTLQHVQQNAHTHTHT